MKTKYLEYPNSLRFALAKFESQWQDCQKCDLCKIRYKVVHIRGTIPCDVCFIGEAPGESEDVLGAPFLGESGSLFNDLLAETRTILPDIPRVQDFTFCMINMVGCFPGKDPKGNFNKPHKESLHQCEPRLRQLLMFSRPKLIVTLGALAAKKLPSDLAALPGLQLVHPSSILRERNPNQKRLASKRFVTNLASAILTLF